MNAVRSEEEVLFSGYETASEGQGLSGGCLSGSGEWQTDKSATDFDRLEHVGSPPQPDNGECCILDVLTTPPPLLLDSYDESLSVAVRRESVKSGREKTEEEGGGSEREGKGGAVGGSGKGEEGEGVKGEEGEGVKKEDKKCEGFTCPNHLTEPLVVHNTNVLYITYHYCCHAPSLSDIKLSPSHSTQCLYCHPVYVSTYHPHTVTHSTLHTVAHSTLHTITITPHKHTKVASHILTNQPNPPNALHLARLTPCCPVKGPYVHNVIGNVNFYI